MSKKVTKQDTIDELTQNLKRLEEENERLDEANIRLQDRLANTMYEKTGILTWVANNSAGQPVCVAGNDNEDSDDYISVCVYHRGGRITGVALHDGNGDLRYAEGLIPADVYQEENKWARK